MPARVPVLIVSGFLGSGKTTLVLRLLARAQAAGEKVAVVSNELGELGIDEALLGGGEQRMIELAGGCVCCQLSDELVDTLQMLRDRVDPDRIVIETSGVALPFETQLNLYRPPVSAWVGDEAVVVVVDAETFGRDAGETFGDQVSGADILVLSKVDLVDDADARVARLAELAPGVPIVPARFGDVEPELLFPTGPRREKPAHRAHTHEGFEAVELAVPDGLSEEEAHAWISDRRGLRTKGFVRTREGVRIVQGVGRRLELTDPGELVVAPELQNRVVVIRATGAGHRH
jgi:G3E family GTPase